MRSILIALTGVVAPGFAHGLLRQRRAMWFVIAAVWLPVALISVTIWALVLAMAAWLASLVHAGLRHRQLARAEIVGVPPPSASPLQARLRGQPPPRSQYDWLYPLLAFASSIVIAIVFRLFVVEAYRMPSSSMSPTLQIGDHIFAEKIWRSYERGEVIVFRQPCEPDRDYVKRIVAVAGDTVEVRCNVLYLDGKPVPSERDEAACTYDENEAGWGPDTQDRWEVVPCSRYRETIGGHTFDTFHPPTRPLRELIRRRAQLEGKPGAELDGVNQQIAKMTDDLKRQLAAIGNRRRVGLSSELDSVEEDAFAPASKDYPDSLIIRSCAAQGDPYSRSSSDQQPGKIVVTKESHELDACSPRMHFVVPEDSVFVMGDNRDNSNDSRFWGVVPVSYIKGHVKGIWLPLRRFGAID